MPDQAEACLDRLFALFSQRDLDWEALPELIDPEVVWEVRADFPDAGTYRGYEGMRRLSAGFDEVVEDTWYRPLEYVHEGPYVVVALRWGGRGKGSRTPFAEREETWVIRLRDGRILHVREYATRDEALEAARAGA